jgi:hypothetical protein
MLRACKLLTALGLGIAFSAATVYCLIGSAGRDDEAAFVKNAGARQANADRQRAQRNQAEAKKRYDAALKAEEEECASGAGSRCTAKRETTKLRRSDLEVAEILLRQQPLEQRENGKLKRAAGLIVFFGGRDQADAERGLALVWPFIPPLVCELLTIVFLHLGFGVSGVTPAVRGDKQSPDRSELEPKAPDRSEFKTARSTTQQQLPPGDGQLVLDALAAAGRPLNNNELAAAMGVHKGEATKRRRKVEHLLKAERAGRELRVSLPQRVH